MGKNLQRQGTGISIEANHQGCMWGILHALHHHRWHHVRKKMLPYKRHGGGKHATGVGNPVNRNATNAGEIPDQTDAEMTTPFIGEKAAEPIPVTKSSIKSRIKALIAEEMSKRRGRHHRSSSYPTRIQLTRTDSIHHLEPSDFNPLSEVASNNGSPRIVRLENEENSSSATTSDPQQSSTGEEPVLISNEKCEFCDKLNKAKQDLFLGNSREYEEGVSFHESKQFLDVLDIFNMNKELFLKVLQDPSPPLVHYFDNRRGFNSKIGFTKSMSFPAPGLSDRRGFGPSTPSTSECSPHRMKNRQGNKVGMKGFKNLKRKIKQAMRESRKERHRITMDAVLHKVPHGRKHSKDDVRKLVAGLCSKSFPQSSGESDEKDGPRQIRRISSFDESMDRYRQLYESSIRTEAKYHISERLKLRTEETPSPSPSRTTPKSLGRILSLPDLRAYYFHQSEGSPDSISVGTPNRTDLNSNVGIDKSRLDERKASCLTLGSENETRLDSSVEKGSEKLLVEIGESNIVAKDEVGSRSLSNEEAEGKMGFAHDDLGSLTRAETDAQDENEIQVTISPRSKLAEPSPISVLESSQEDMASPTKSSLCEEADSMLKPRNLFSDEACPFDSLASKQQEAKTETSIEQLDSEILCVLVDTKDAAEFNYIKYVLELSGFSKNELLGTWHSPDQPVDPSLYEEVEGCLVPQPHYPETEQGANCAHLLLFDMINEVLLEIYKRSFTYWPKPLCSTSHFRPVPVGHHVLEEVWTRISWYLSWNPEIGQLLDDAVTRDLAKGDGWMNLQFEAECVGLELEDMIFDDLLDEIL